MFYVIFQAQDRVSARCYRAGFCLRLLPGAQFAAGRREFVTAACFAAPFLRLQGRDDARADYRFFSELSRDAEISIASRRLCFLLIAAFSISSSIFVLFLRAIFIFSHFLSHTAFRGVFRLPLFFADEISRLHLTIRPISSPAAFFA
jgi:hypothetical protein